MSYWRFAAMIATSTIVMFGLMYVHTYALDHVYFSETRAWMALLMGGTMSVVMLGFMWSMYPNRTANRWIAGGGVLAVVLCTWLIRSQVTVDEVDYMAAMVPHHSIAILTSTRARIDDARVRKLAREIVLAQRKEIAEMRYLIRALRRGPAVERPAARPETVTAAAGEAARSADLATTDLEPLTRDEIARMFASAATCRFSFAPGDSPVAVAAAGGDRGLIKLHGRLVPMDAQHRRTAAVGFELAGDDVRVVTTAIEDAAAAGESRDAEAVLTIGESLEAGYAGVYVCGTS